jgi:hypothetical protein
MAFENLDFAMQGRKPRPGEQAEFRRVRVWQRFRLDGDLCQRIDRGRDRLGPYNAVSLDGGGSPKRIHILDHEVVTIVG